MRAEKQMAYPVVDAKEREAALDPEKSFIVQAPAGSGKTELLTQRYLKLLSRVEDPEQIIAITFTRKAAAEMRGRIMDALSAAKCPDPPGAAHARRTWMLAGEALSQNDQREWNLPENPSRLRVQTIDSLCAGLIRQMPFLSRLGAPPEITEQAADLYREAAKNTVAELESGARWSPSIEALIRHLDNHLDRVEALIAGMLARRDQWLRHVAARGDEHRQREMLEQNLREVIEETLACILDHFQGEALGELAELACFAAKNLAQTNPGSPVCGCGALDSLPGTTPDQVSLWRGICELLLTQSGDWRKIADKRIGFPAPGGVKGNAELKRIYQEKKEGLKNLIETLSADAALAGILHSVRMLPPDRYEDDQWQIMRALFEILTVAVGHLQLVFSQSGQVDFAEVVLRAAAALGTPEQPTDLTLSLDYRLRHILIDEFQDTSFTQFKLLEQLTAGWEPGDGRTVFAVGDPMQSIYAFREAEVGLFLKARRQGLENISLLPLRLTVNFRSQQQIVGWVNTCFSAIMPDAENITTGAVSYAKSAAFHPAESGMTVAVHPLVPADREKEASKVVDCIRQARRQDPNGSIAVLVRSRPHLEWIAPKLKEAGLRFLAVEIESLQNRVAIRDLISLTRALSHPADRIAWLAVLRAPWCGLVLSDLYRLVENAPDQIIAELMQDPDRLAGLSGDGRDRLVRVREILLPLVEHRGRRSLRRHVEGAWLALGGPACVFAPSDLADVRVFFDLLDKQESAGGDAAALETAVGQLFAGPDAQSDEKLQIMTIHKAKGLEFDTVILPGLERTPPGPDKQLLLWLERTVEEESRLLLAPISGAGVRENPIYDYINLLYREKEFFEDTRLLYVAATRAKKQLHLIGGADPSDEPGRVKPPSQKSLLKALWPAVGEVFDRAAATGRGEAALPPKKVLSPPGTSCIRRLKHHFKLPEPAREVNWSPRFSHQPEIVPPDRVPVFDWAGEAARLVGIVVHDWLKVIGEQGVKRWPAERIIGMDRLFEQDLIRAGMVPDRPDTPLGPPSRGESDLISIRGKLRDYAPIGEGAQNYSIHKKGAPDHSLLKGSAPDNFLKKGAPHHSPLGRGHLHNSPLGGGHLHNSPLRGGSGGCSRIAEAAKQVSAALISMLKDDRGIWILSEHAVSACEYALTGRIENEIVSVVMDRTFVDGDGTRWIIDYKTGAHLGGSMAEFLDREQERYARQMERYARLMSAAEDRPIRVGLYYPQMTGWREWAYEMVREAN